MHDGKRLGHSNGWLQARQLFKAGIRSPECIAKSSPAELAVILRQGAVENLAPNAASSYVAQPYIGAGFSDYSD